MSELRNRYTFNDKEIGSPKHDAIMLWADRQFRSDADLTRALGFNGHWPVECIERTLGNASYSPSSTNEDYRKAHAESEKADTLRGPKPARPYYKFSNLTWEYCLKDKNYVVGFLDFLLELNRAYLFVDDSDFIDGNNQSPPGSWGVRWETVRIAIEVKPKITSIGEVLRQVAYYRAKSDVCRLFYVMSKENTEAIEVFRSHSIGFIAVPDHVLGE